VDRGDFGTRLRRAREKAGLAREELALAVGKTAQAVLHWEAGRRSPSLADLKILARILDVSVDWLVGVAEQEETDAPWERRRIVEDVASIIPERPLAVPQEEPDSQQQQGADHGTEPRHQEADSPPKSRRQR
jgi:transcriptional regulator with XRE-family HTH domain